MRPSHSCIIFAIAAFLIVPLSLIADDGLPKDGAWARYYVQSKRGDGTERTYHTTISFVGTVVVDGQKHRWLEVLDEFVVEDGGKTVKRKDVRKFLIAEKSLRGSSNPLREFVRGWVGEVGKTPNPFQGDTRTRELYDGLRGPLLVFLPGVSKHAKPTKKPRGIDYQKGRLQIKSSTAGTFRSAYHVTSAVLKWKSDYEIWRHKDVALGMASLKVKTVRSLKQAKQKETVQDVATTEFWVEAWGTDAKSALPKAN